MCKLPAICYSIFLIFLSNLGLSQSANIVLSAEDFDSNTAGISSKEGDEWIFSTEKSGYIGSGYMHAAMGAGDGSIENAQSINARMSYVVDFVEYGDYYLWARVWYDDGSSDSFYYGIDGVVTDRLSGSSYGAWAWQKGGSTLTIETTGKYSLDIMQREPNARVDVLILTVDPDYNPANDSSWISHDPPEPVSGLIINELMAANAHSHYDRYFYNFSDWVEVKNVGDKSIRLSNCFLSDDPDHLMSFRFPPVDLPPGGYYIVYCDDESAADHTRFSLSTSGETLTLSNATGQMLDQVSFPEQYTDISYGRDAQNNWTYNINPTPAMPNDPLTGTGRSQKIEFSPSAGRYAASTSVAMAGQNARYTLDGSEPEATSSSTTVPLTISKTMVVKAKSYENRKLPGKTTAATYFINEHPFTLPVVSLSFDPDYFYDETIGIHVKGTNGTAGPCSNIANWNQDWERGAYFEYFDAKGTRRIAQSVGLKIAGGCTRGRDQKSLSIYARSKYGDKDFDYSFFDHKPYINTFKSLLLRNSGNDQDLTLLRDAFIQELVRYSTDIDCQSYQPTAVYFNGEYRGIMNLREKLDEDYVWSNYHIDSDEIDFLEKNMEVIRGSAESAKSLIAYVNENDITKDDVFAEVASQVDIRSFTDYMAVQVYIGNTDWPQNNLKFWKPKNYGKWRWMLYDTDYGFGFRRDAPDVESLERVYGRQDFTSVLFTRLMQNDQFAQNFSDRILTLMQTSFSPKNCDRILDSLSAVISAEISYNQQKYGRTKQDWLNEVAKLRKQTHDRYTFMQGYLSNRFPAAELTHIQIINNAPHQGKVMINETKIMDYPINLSLSTAYVLTVTAVAEKGYQFDHWESTDSATLTVLNKTSFTSPTLIFFKSPEISLQPIFTSIEAFDKLYINEIASKKNALLSQFFGPSGYIELYNDSDDEVTLHGFYLSDDKDNYTRFSIPDGTQIPAKGFLILDTDGNTLKGIYHANFELNSKGDEVYLSQKIGTSLRLVDYLSATNLPDSESYGRYPDGTGSWQSMEQTPNQPNIGTEKTLSAPDQILLPTIRCYPNPSNGVISIACENTHNRPQKILITDISGKVLHEFWLNEYEVTLNLSHLQTGIYQLHLYTDGQLSQSQKILINP